MTASKDISLGGNYSFTAHELRSSKLSKGRVPIIGTNGALLDTDKFTFSKGVLKVPSLHVDSLSSDIDAKGSDIKNVVLTSSKIQSASSIETSKFRMPGLKGPAFFTDEGYLQALSDSNSQLTAEDKDKGNYIEKLTLNTLIFENKDEQLSIDSFGNIGESSSEGSIAILGISTTGHVKATLKDHLSIDRDGVIKAKSIMMNGDILMNGHTIHATSIVGGQFTNISSISTSSLRIASSAFVQYGDDISLLGMNSLGQVCPVVFDSNKADHSILTVSSQGRPELSSQIRIESLGADDVHASRVYADDLYISESAFESSTFPSKVLLYDPTTKHVILSSIDSLLTRKEDGGQKHSKVSMNSLEYDMALLAYNTSSGEIGYAEDVFAKKALVQDLIVQNTLSVERIMIPKRDFVGTQGNLLAYDQDQQTLHPVEGFYFNASSNNFHAPSATIKTIKSSHVSIETLSISSLETIQGDGSILAWNSKNNRVGYSSSIVIDDDEYLKVKGIRSTTQDGLKVDKLSIIGNQSLSSHAIVEVHGKTDLLGDTYVEGSLTVRFAI